MKFENPPEITPEIKKGEDNLEKVINAINQNLQNEIDNLNRDSIAAGIADGNPSFNDAEREETESKIKINSDEINRIKRIKNNLTNPEYYKNN